MSSNFEIELDDSGIREMLHDSSLMAQCEEIAQNQIARNGGRWNYEVVHHNGSSRGWKSVKSNDWGALRHANKVNWGS